MRKLIFFIIFLAYSQPARGGLKGIWKKNVQLIQPIHKVLQLIENNNAGEALVVIENYNEQLKRLNVYKNLQGYAFYQLSQPGIALSFIKDKAPDFSNKHLDSLDPTLASKLSFIYFDSLLQSGQRKKALEVFHLYKKNKKDNIFWVKLMNLGAQEFFDDLVSYSSIGSHYEMYSSLFLNSSKEDSRTRLSLLGHLTKFHLILGLQNKMFTHLEENAEIISFEFISDLLVFMKNPKYLEYQCQDYFNEVYYEFLLLGKVLLGHSDFNYALAQLDLGNNKYFLSTLAFKEYQDKSFLNNSSCLGEKEGFEEGVLIADIYSQLGMESRAMVQLNLIENIFCDFASKKEAIALQEFRNRYQNENFIQAAQAAYSLNAEKLNADNLLALIYTYYYLEDIDKLPQYIAMYNIINNKEQRHPLLKKISEDIKEMR